MYGSNEGSGTTTSSPGSRRARARSVRISSPPLPKTSWSGRDAERAGHGLRQRRGAAVGVEMDPLGLAADRGHRERGGAERVLVGGQPQHRAGPARPRARRAAAARRRGRSRRGSVASGAAWRTECTIVRPAARPAALGPRVSAEYNRGVQPASPPPVAASGVALASRVGSRAPRRDPRSGVPAARGRRQLRVARLGLPLRHDEAAPAGRALPAGRPRPRGHVPGAPHVPRGAAAPDRRPHRSARPGGEPLVAAGGRHRAPDQRGAGDGDRGPPRPRGAAAVRLARWAPRRRPPGAEPGVDRERALRDGRRRADLLRRRGLRRGGARPSERAPGGDPGDGRAGGARRLGQVLRGGGARHGARGRRRRPAPRAGSRRRAPRGRVRPDLRRLCAEHAAPAARARPLASPGPGLAGAVHRQSSAGAPAVLARWPRGPRPRARVVRAARMPGRPRRDRPPGASRLAGDARPDDPRDRARDLRLVPPARPRRPLPRDPRPLRGAGCCGSRGEPQPVVAAGGARGGDGAGRARDRGRAARRLPLLDRRHARAGAPVAAARLASRRAADLPPRVRAGGSDGAEPDPRHGYPERRSESRLVLGAAHASR